MITNNDIEKLAKVLATKDDVSDLHNNIEAIQTSVNSLTTSVDGLAKTVGDLKTENTAIKHKLNLV
jgi:phage shock protein A